MLNRVYEIPHSCLNQSPHEMIAFSPLQLSTIHMSHELNPMFLWTTLSAKVLLGTVYNLCRNGQSKEYLLGLHGTFGPGKVFHVLGTLLLFPRTWLTYGVIVTGESPVHEYWRDDPKSFTELQKVLVDFLIHDLNLSKQICDQHPYFLALLATHYSSFAKALFAGVKDLVLQTVQSTTKLFEHHILTHSSAQLHAMNLSCLNRIHVLFQFISHLQKMNDSVNENADPAQTTDVFVQGLWNAVYKILLNSDLAKQKRLQHFISLKNVWLSFFLSLSELSRVNRINNK